MINAPHDKEFVFHDGTRARNLLDVVSKLETMSDHEFHHFVNAHKNDFATWTDHVLSDKPFAEKLRTVSSRMDTIQLIKDKINDVVMSHAGSSSKSIGFAGVHTPRVEHHGHEGHNHAPAAQISDDTHLEIEDHSNNVSVDENVSKMSSKSSTSSVSVSFDGEEKVHEKSVESRARHNWFKLLSRKDLSEKKIESLESEEEDKLMAENSLKTELVQTERENALWIALYFALVLLIITLLVYKLFL